MKLFISVGISEVFIILLFLLMYVGLFILAVYIMRGIFKINKFDKHQAAQTRLLSEMAKLQGVDENIIREIELTLINSR